MSDRYQAFTDSAIGQLLVKNLGLPNPTRLERYRAGDPLVQGTVAIGGTGRLVESLPGLLDTLGIASSAVPGQPGEDDRFKGLVWNFFAHTQTRHDLVTQQERARAKFDVRIGDRVAFTFDGTRHVGVVNRITRRATVLVECGDGELYRDGKRYIKFYIPLPILEKVD